MPEAFEWWEVDYEFIDPSTFPLRFILYTSTGGIRTGMYASRGEDFAGVREEEGY